MNEELCMLMDRLSHHLCDIERNLNDLHEIEAECACFLGYEEFCAVVEDMHESIARAYSQIEKLAEQRELKQ